MNPVHVLEVGTGSAVPVAAVGAVPVQRLPQWQTPIASRAVHVLIAGPDWTVNEGLATALSRIGAQRVVRADSAPAVRDLLARGVTGDLALVSARFGTDTDALIGALRGGGWPRVIVCVPTGAAPPAVGAVLAGATGVLTTPGTAHDPCIAHTTLTRREIQVITQVAGGCSNKEIGTRLSLSALTVKNHLARIGRKLGTGDRAKLVALAYRAGIITWHPAQRPTAPPDDQPTGTDGRATPLDNPGAPAAAAGHRRSIPRPPPGSMGPALLAGAGVTRHAGRNPSHPNGEAAPSWISGSLVRAVQPVTSAARCNGSA